MPQLSYLTDHDSSDEFTYCVRVKELGELAKLAYYAAKLMKSLRTSPAPPP